MTIGVHGNATNAGRFSQRDGTMPCAASAAANRVNTATRSQSVTNVLLKVIYSLTRIGRSEDEGTRKFGIIASFCLRNPHQAICNQTCNKNSIKASAQPASQCLLFLHTSRHQIICVTRIRLSAVFTYIAASCHLRNPHQIVYSF